MEGGNGLVKDAAPLVDAGDLARALKAVGSPVRLQLMAQLKHPTPARTLLVKAGHTQEGQNPDRPIAIQGVRHHLRQLANHGLVLEDEGDGDGRRLYVVNRPRLYALAEAFRDLAMLYGSQASPQDRTMAKPPGPRVDQPRGPRLVLVHGAYEGKAFALNAEAENRMTIGRTPGATVCLDYDPFVSRRHASIVRHGDGFALVDDGTSRNGTLLNWQIVDRGEPYPLRPGNVVGVGRSALVFMDD